MNTIDIEALKKQNPTVRDIAALCETAYINENKKPIGEAIANCELTMDDVRDAEARLLRFSDYFKKAFPETKASGGILESPLKEIEGMKKALEEHYDFSLNGKLMIKLDSHLAISGSIKARGGIYEVLKTAEDIAIERGLLREGDSYEVFDSPEFKKVFSEYSIAVGSTGNLGLSIGIMSAKLGFNVTVHMSADAREWKKKMLRNKGVIVKEYESDYSRAVYEGRIEAEGNPFCHFVDDENSKTLFLGYAVAALRLKKQLEELKITVDSEHPLFVYLPCGVGGGPGGVAFGIKLVFGDAAHTFFAEPTHSACMMLGMASGLHSDISVGDLGVDNITAADGLAVGRASGFVGRLMTPFMSGCYSLSDERMFSLLKKLADSENIFLEPSALAGMYGPVLISKDEILSNYPEKAGITKAALKNTTHLVWATGGSMVPEDEMKKYYSEGERYERA